MEVTKCKPGFMASINVFNYATKPHLRKNIFHFLVETVRYVDIKVAFPFTRKKQLLRHTTGFFVYATFTPSQALDTVLHVHNIHHLHNIIKCTAHISKGQKSNSTF